jgi:hypothetical protein
MSCCSRPSESASSTDSLTLRSAFATDARIDLLSGIHAAGFCAAPMTAGSSKTLSTHPLSNDRSCLMSGRRRSSLVGGTLLLLLLCTLLPVAWLRTLLALLPSSSVCSLLLLLSCRSRLTPPQPPAWSELLLARLEPGCAPGVPAVVLPCILPCTPVSAAASLLPPRAAAVPVGRSGELS